MATIFQDERGSRSMARLLMLATCTVLLVLAIADSVLAAVTVSTDAYAALGGLAVVLGAWAGGPRAMQHLAPVARAAFARFGSGGGGAARSTTVVVGDNPRIDDERDE